MFLARWRWWTSTHEARNETRDIREVTSFAAEDSVANVVKRHPSVIRVFQGIRVLDPDRMRGAGETDTIAITTRGVIVIETKNWRSDIICIDGDIIQKKLLSARKKVPVISKIETKAGHLSRWLRSLVRNPELDVTPLVVLAHQFSKPTEEVLRMGSVTKLDGLLDKIDEIVSSSEELPVSEIERIINTVNRFGTFDSISFDGGNIIHGDFDKMPLGWIREDVRIINVKIHGNRFQTLIRGPKLHLEIISWDGSVDQKIIRAGEHHVSIRPPWAKVSKVPLENLSSISFGNQGQEMEFQLNPVISRKEVNSTNLDEKGVLESGKQNTWQFSKGMVLEDKIVLRHLKKDGKTHSLLIELIPKGQKGLLSTTHLSDIHPVMFTTLFAEGKGVDVKVLKVKNNGNVVLGLP